jgi:ferredoxin--NADP+ reductase
VSAIPAPLAAGRPSPFFEEQVTWVRHWTDQLFSFGTRRDPGFRFASGQFVMLGLELDGRPLLRAYSIASPSWDEALEFYSIKVDGGPLTSHLKLIKPGDTVLVGRKATGTLVLDALRPGRTLYLLSTGTGLAPFLSLIRDPDVYDRFERVVVTHTCRAVADLSYADLIRDELPADPYLGELISERLTYYPTVTREDFRNRGRITDLIESGRLFADIGAPGFDPAADRVMICGGPDFLRDVKAALLARGFEEGSLANAGDFVIERAFVES